jgi:hypothetical protein
VVVTFVSVEDGKHLFLVALNKLGKGVLVTLPDPVHEGVVDLGGGEAKSGGFLVGVCVALHVDPFALVTLLTLGESCWAY